MGIIPLSTGIAVKFHSQFIPNSTVQQSNLEEAVRFGPNPLLVYFPNPLLVYFPNPFLVYFPNPLLVYFPNPLLVYFPNRPRRIRNSCTTLCVVIFIPLLKMLMNIIISNIAMEASNVRNNVKKHSEYCMLMMYE
jgi:hypothetical protein